MATPAAEQLAHRLRTLREEARLTQGDLATMFTEDGRRIGAAAVSAWERLRDPVPLPENRLEPYSRLPAMSRNPLRIPSLDELTAPQRVARDELLSDLTKLLDQARPDAVAGEAVRTLTYRSWFFADNGPVVIIAPDAPEAARGPLADPSDPNYVTLHSYADQDALIELHGHIRAENDPALPVFFRLASQVRADDLTGHVVLLGGIAWNRLTSRLLRELSRLPVRQVESPEVTTGEIFVVGHGKEEKQYFPTWSRTDNWTERELEEDVGLLARVRNPFNSSKTMTLCNGIHSRGVLGAVRALSDARIRESNESYLAQRFPQGEYCLLVRVPVLEGVTLSPDLQQPDNVLYAWPDVSSSRKTTRERA